MLTERRTPKRGRRTTHMQKLDSPVRASLRLVETELAAENLETAILSCNGTMTCVCQSCSDERRSRVFVGVRPSNRPWIVGQAA